MSFRSETTLLHATAIERRRTNRAWFVQGFVNNLRNPKGTLFYLGVFTVVITPGTSARAMLVLICSVMLASASFWLLLCMRWIARLSAISRSGSVQIWWCSYPRGGYAEEGHRRVPCLQLLERPSSLAFSSR